MLGIAFLVGMLFGVVCGLVVAFHVGVWASERDKRRIRRFLGAMTPEQRREFEDAVRARFEREVL